jgi:hypothetical protein
VKVGLVIRGQNELRTIEIMKYRKKSDQYIGKFSVNDEVTAGACFACIAYLPGTMFHKVATIGPVSCPDNGALYEKWLKERNTEE